MTRPRLTKPRALATSLPMEQARQVDRRSGGRVVVMAGAMTALGLLAGCISVTAPDKPIVIELNINIKQEVIYRLAADAAKTVEENPDIF